ncbi:MAG: hypothetical protein M3Q23_13820 [Actinomycetota bacterium]|nr:hypothetical protein [Actinomycetota bacterium]
MRVGTIVSCPATATVLATGSAFYPPWFPVIDGLPPDPLHCFASVEQAEAAGFTAAAAPPGGLEVGGVYLVPAHLEPTCRRAARRLGFPVACPGLVPGSPDAFQPYTLERGLFQEFLLDGTFPAPPGYVGFAAGGEQPFRPATGHLIVETDAEYPMNGRYGRRGYCSNQRAAGHVVVRGVLGQFVLCPPGSEQHSHHVVLDWGEGGHTYAVSLHGHTALNRRLDRTIAEHVVLVGG